MEFQTKYRILKTSWGIAIDISGTVKESAADKNVLTISDRGVTPEEKEQTLQGLESVLTQITVDSRKYNIDIQKIWFNPCDFQTDALFWAGRDWISKALHLKSSEPEILYDRTLNQYSFNLIS